MGVFALPKCKHKIKMHLVQLGVAEAQMFYGVFKRVRNDEAFVDADVDFWDEGQFGVGVAKIN